MITYGNWVNLYPCKECDNLLGPSAFDNGKIYKPCQRCGGKIGFSITGRAKYQESIVEKRRLFGLIKYKVRVKQFIGWEKR